MQLIPVDRIVFLECDGIMLISTSRLFRASIRNAPRNRVA
jgi:hypothetical protein